MIKKLFLIISLAFAMTIVGNAQTFQTTDLGVKAMINSVEVEIQFYNRSTVRVLKSPEGKTFTKEEAQTAIDVSSELLNIVFRTVIKTVGLHLHEYEICNCQASINNSQHF